MIGFIGVVVSFLASAFLAAFGLYSGAIKKIVAVAIKSICLVFHIEQEKERQKTVKIGEDVKKIFPEIKKAKKSQENIEKVSSVSYIGLVIIVIAAIGLVLNMTVLNNETISQKISQLLKMKLETVKVYWTSGMFALITSGASMCFNQWKKGYEYRKGQSLKKLKEAAKRELTEEELIQLIESKVEEKKLGI